MPDPAPAQQPDSTKRVPIIGADGNPYTVLPEDLQEEVAKGSRPMTLEEEAKIQSLRRAGTASGLPTFLTSAAQTIPFAGGYISKDLERAFGKTPEQIEAESQMHPIARMGGTATGVAGQIAAISATGGLEGLAEGSGILGEGGMEGLSSLGRLGVKSAIGSTEGGLYGAGGAVNDAVLNNHPLTAEMLLSHAAGGALIGGALAGGLSLAGDALEKPLERIGNARRAKTLSNVVDTDLRSLNEAGIGQKEINRAFDEGIVAPGDTPAAVQSRIAEKMAGIQEKIGELGQKIDSSGQTIDLRKLIVKEASESDAPEGMANLLQPGDEAATFGRVAQMRQGLIGQSSKAARGLLLDLDDELFAKAGNISKAVGEDARELLGDHREFYAPLARAADEAVKNVHVPDSDTAIDALSRQGSHFGAWRALSRMAMGHPGSPFMAMSAANYLRKVVTNPGAIGDTFLGGLRGISKATSASEEDLNAAVLAAVEGAHHSTGHLAEGLSGVLLPEHATDAEVQAVREKLLDANRNTIPGGHPDLMQALARQRQMLLSALPPPVGNPNLPKSLARPELGPPSKQVQGYNDLLRAIAQPMGVVGDLGSGKASRAQIAAFATAYPALAQRTTQKLMNAAAESKKPASPALKRSIEMLHGLSIDPTTTPQKIARIQGAAFAQAQPPQTPGRGGAKQGGGAMKLNQKGLAALTIGDRISLGMVGARDEASGKR